MTDRGEVTVPHHLTGPTAVLIRWALAQFRRESGGALRYVEPDLYRLVDDLADAARTPPDDVAASGNESGDLAGSVGRLVDMGYAVEATGIAARTLRWQCANGRVPGAVRVAGRWLIPSDTLEELRRAR